MAFPFLPYGVLPGGFKKKGQAMDLVMNAWRPHLDQEERLQTFNQWREDRLAEFNAAIWPRYHPQSGDWTGDATNFAEALTRFEIGVMVSEFFGDSPVLQQKPQSPLAKPDIGTQLEHYVYEDVDAPGSNFHFYDKTMTDDEIRHFEKTMVDSITTNKHIGEKVTGHFWFKAEMQRPRPLHTALLFGYQPGFRSELSNRGQHPSIVSGHAFQGVMMSCAVLENWLESKSKPAADRLDALAQYSVDVGDRRVFAGVHYPSDNIASWVLALSLIPEVFDDAGPIRDFVVKAIVEKSAVYHVVNKLYAAEASAGPAISLMAKYGLPVNVAA